MIPAQDLSPYLSGEKLYGDDFGEKEIAEWYNAELEGYAALGSKDKGKYEYSYHAANWFHFFQYIKNGSFNHALGIGSAYGDELVPICGQIGRISIVEPYSGFECTHVGDTPVSYSSPTSTGKLEFDDESFDLVLCLGVLHHIANVSDVWNEIMRCLRPGGLVFVREPIISMGDWRLPRKGLTWRERGIPHHLMEEILLGSGVRIERAFYCFFPPLNKFAKKLGVDTYNNNIAVSLDLIFSRMFSWNSIYHRKTLLRKFAPASAGWIVRKNDRRKLTT